MMMGQSPIEVYPAFVKRLFVNRSTDLDGLLHAAVGLSTESGECLDVVKKTWAFNKPLDTHKLTHEAGDTLFYLQALCNLLGITINQLATLNMQKLSARYPDGYNDKDASLRRDNIT